MFSKTNILASLAGFFVLYLLGWFFYGIIADDFFMQHTLIKNMHKKDSIDGVWQIAIGSFLISLFMSSIYQKWSQGDHNLKTGFNFGALIGALIGLGLGMVMYATTNFMDFTGQLTDGIWSIFYYGFTGAVISFVYKKMDA